MSIFRCAFVCRMFIDSTSAGSSRAGSRPETLRVGDELVFSPANKSSMVATDRALARAGKWTGCSGRFDRNHFDRADFCRARLCRFPRKRNADRDESFSRGSFLDRSRADARWRLYDLRLATQEVKCQIVSIDRVMDSSSLDRKTDKRDHLERNEVGTTNHSNARPPRARQSRSHRQPRPICHRGRRPDLRRGHDFRRHLHRPRGHKEHRIFFGPKAKSRQERRAARSGHRGRWSGSPVFPGPENRQLRKRSNTNCSNGGCTPMCSMATIFATA